MLPGPCGPVVYSSFTRPPSPHRQPLSPVLILLLAPCSVYYHVLHGFHGSYLSYHNSPRTRFPSHHIPAKLTVLQKSTYANAGKLLHWTNVQSQSSFNTSDGQCRGTRVPCHFYAATSSAARRGDKSAVSSSQWSQKQTDCTDTAETSGCSHQHPVRGLDDDQGRHRLARCSCRLQ